MKCKEKATWAIPWGGKIIKGCAKHLNQILTIARITGNPVEPERIYTEVECQMHNEDKEGKKAVDEQKV